jgi:O-antigen ligase
MYALLVAVVALFAAIAGRDLKLALALFAAALPAYLLRFSVGPIPSTLLEALFAVLFVVWAVKTDAWKRQVLPREWALPLGLLLLAGVIGIIVSPDVRGALGLFKAYLVEPILLFLIVRDVADTAEERSRLLLGLGVGALFVAVAGIVQYVSGAGIPVPWDIERRVTSVFPYPNAVGLYLGPVAIIGLVAAFAEQGKRRAFWAVVVFFSLVAIVLAKTEAAYVAIPVTLFIFLVRRPKWQKNTLLATAAILLFISVVPPVRDTVIQKLTLHDLSGQVRLSQWADTERFLKDHPLFGAGLDGYPIAIEPYHTHPEYEIFQDPHDVFLNVWVELGLLGLVAAALIARRVWQSKKLDWIAVAASFALLEMCIHGLVDVPFFKNDLAMMTFLLVALAS